MRKIIYTVKIHTSWINLQYVDTEGPCLELVSKELNHFGVIADLFRQIGIVVDLCYFAIFIKND